MGGDQRNMALHSKSDRHVYADSMGMGGSNVFVSVRGGGRGGAPPPTYRSRDSNSMDGGSSWRGGRGRSRLPEGHWRGGSRGGGGSSSGSISNNFYYSRGGSVGRRPPPPRYDDLLDSREPKPDRQLARQEMWRGGRGASRGMRRGVNNKYRVDRRPGGSHSQQQSSSGWQKITIYDCAQYEPVEVMKEVASMVGESFDSHLLSTEGNNITFYLEDSHSIGKSLMELSKRLAMPNSNQRLTIAVVASNNPPFQPPTEDNLAKVKLLMAERYSGHLKRLDLAEFHKDKNFRSISLLFPLYVPSNLASVGRLIVANIPEVTEIDLSRNKLVRLEAVASHLKACPSLTRLHLNNNKLQTVSSLQKLKGLAITELTLDGNPLCNRYKNIEAYISDIRDVFPKLLVLDGKELPRPIGFEVDDTEVVTPPFLPSYFCNEQAKNIVLLFLKQYYQVFDSSDRSPLRAAYCEDAIFSVSTLLPENGARAMAVDNERLPNRNLKVRQNVDDRVDLLFRGRDDVMKQIMTKLPPTTHDLDSLVVDVPIAKPQLMQVIVSGVYRREGVKNKSVSTRAFQRSLVIVPEGEGFCIANEQLYVTLATIDQIKDAFKSEVAGSSSSGPTPVPSVAASPVPSSTGGLEPCQLQMIETFSEKSNMKPEFSKMCLEENSWDFNKAAERFLQLKTDGKLPPEYFKQ